MNCVHCQVPLPDGARFCAACGTPQPEPKPQNRCANCGAELPQGAGFCNKCGANQSQQAPAAPVPSFCRTCGNELAPGAGFCNKCGTPVAAAPTRGGLSPAAKKGIFIGGGALLLVIALVVILVVVLSGGGAESVAEKYLSAKMINDYETMLECYTDRAIMNTLADSTSHSYAELSEKSRSELIDLCRKELIEDPDSTYYKGKIDKESEIVVVSSGIVETSTDEELEAAKVWLRFAGYTTEECESITDAVTVRVEYRRASSTSDNTNTVSITCIEMSGSWYVLE